MSLYIFSLAVMVILILGIIAVSWCRTKIKSDVLFLTLYAAGLFGFIFLVEYLSKLV